MPKSDVALLERVAELEAHVQTLSRAHTLLQTQVESLTRAQSQSQAQSQAQAEARARVRAEFQAQVQAHAQARAQAEAESLARAQAEAQRQTPVAPHLEAETQPAADAEAEAAALVWAEARFARSFNAAPILAVAPAMCAAVSVEAVAPRGRVSQPRSVSLPRPVAAVSHRITDTLSDLRVSLGAGHAMSAAVDRLLNFLGIWRASEWDDRDDLRDSSTFAPILPWYRRSGLLIFFIAVAVAIFVAVGGLGWTKSKLTHETPRAAIPAVVAEPAPVPAVEAPRVNMLAGTPFEKSASAKSGQR